MRTASRFVLALCIAAAVALPVSAESSAAALEWVNALKSVERDSFRLEYSSTMNITQQGQAMSMEMTGSLTQADQQHMRASIDMTMQLAAGEEIMPMKVSMILVGDGETMWIEMDNPMLGGRQVMKMGFDMMDQMSEINPSASDQIDPFAKVEQLAEIFDFEVGAETAETVTLMARVTAEALEKLAAESSMGAALDPSMVQTLEIVVDKKTSLPRALTISGDQPIMQMNFTNYEKLKHIDPKLFEYTPPEGTQVLDLSTMLGGQ